MDLNQIMQLIANSLDRQIMNFEWFEQISYDNKLVETLRQSNQIEIMNMKAKYKQIVLNIFQTFLEMVQKETSKYQSNILMKNLEQIQLIELQKKKINEYQSLIQEINDENIQLRVQLQLRSQDQTNLNLIIQYQEILNALQQELDQLNNYLVEKDRQIQQGELLIQTLKEKIQNLEQQVNQLNNQQTMKTKIEIIDKQQCKILKEQSTQFENMEEKKLNQYDKLAQIQMKIIQKTTNNQLQNISQSRSQNKTYSVCLKVPKQKPQVQDQDMQSSSFIANNVQKNQTQNAKNNSTFSNHLILQKIKMRKKQNLDDLYLYSKSQRNSRIDIDQYYEPQLFYRYNLLEKLRQ